MGLADLGTLDARPRMAVPKGAKRLDEKEASRKGFDKAWEECKRIVDARTGGKCQCCGQHTEKTLELKANRREHAHIVRRRKEKALLTDPRNLLLLCYRDHERLDEHEILVVQKEKHKFEVDGKKFINAGKPLSFVAWTPKQSPERTSE